MEEAREGTGPSCLTKATPEVRGRRKGCPGSTHTSVPLAQSSLSQSTDMGRARCMLAPGLWGSGREHSKRPFSGQVSPLSPSREGQVAHSTLEEAEAALDTLARNTKSVCTSIWTGQALPAQGFRGSGGPAPPEAPKLLSRWPPSVPVPGAQMTPRSCPPDAEPPSPPAAGLPAWQGPALVAPSSLRPRWDEAQSCWLPAGTPIQVNTEPATVPPPRARCPAQLPAPARGQEVKPAQQERPQSRPRPHAEASLPTLCLGLTCSDAEARGL